MIQLLTKFFNLSSSKVELGIEVDHATVPWKGWLNGGQINLLLDMVDHQLGVLLGLEVGSY
ncbi:hypothetical protein EJB10_00010 [Wolbachia endosymbiont of Brugia malayi]|uniref:hypothetical protein n=1 Tax=Wolbachia endosymbiont of Brugia malayi TaxID=80849 RepID=UPI00004C940D|nr:hypothetical protein [Wolbachia endosymbiont of Brugia malayi]AAW71101.1 Predicted protein [Wolbachia endosymbiont strain TRS of Brugia malayi]QCB61307.1 hypothetical protein EJB10_00010 [Wolbachia endosymbiont of Brugia malayi]